MLPLISVIIPTYNSANYLHRALSSVVKQTYTNWEAVVVDNHSTDNTDDVVRDIGDDRIRLLKINNKGVIAASRNMAIRHAMADWVAFLDADDAWDPNKLMEATQYFNNADLIFHDMIIDYKDGKKIYQPKLLKGRILKHPVVVDLLVESNPISNSSVIVRKGILSDIGYIDENPGLTGCEDYHAWLRISKLTDRFVYIPKAFSSVRLN